MVVYLAPGDYHRFHSPTTFTANYRRHIPGYLQPVDPRYLKGHKDVLKTNERVNLLGDWEHGFFAMSFVGALNVGSIKLHFDNSLLSNIVNPGKTPFQDKNYGTLTEADQAFWKFPVRKKTLGRSFIDSVNPDDVLDINEHLTEFDVKDMIVPPETTDRKFKGDFLYSATQENLLPFNVMNGFKTAVENAESDAQNEQE